MSQLRKVISFPVDALSDRELEILRLLKAGLSNQEVAERLFLSNDTIKWHNKQIFSKLGVNRRTQAIARADELALLQGRADSSLPSPLTLPFSTTNLPAAVNTFIGREADQREILALLSENRLVTVTGTGGTGKTRLALEVARQLTGQFPDGVWMVDLAPLTEANNVPQAVLDALHLHPQVGQMPVDFLKSYFRDKQLLLLLDNFEHLLDAASFVNAWLRSDAKLRVLVTSREALRIEGEQEYSVLPFALPDVDAPPDSLAEAEAVRLFIDRARAVRPDVSFSKADIPLIVSICVRLDGLPLAIELAAARIRLFTVEALLSQLSRLYDVLSDGARNLPLRQRTMRSTVEWSFNLLSADEKRLFAYCGIFVNGWTLEAMRTVTQHWRDSGSVISGVNSLLIKNMIRVMTSPTGEPRFTMLETLRQFAIDVLDERDWRVDAAAAHARCYLNLVEAAQPHFFTRREPLWLDRLEADYGNIRVALEWFRAAADGAESELRMTGGLGWFWFHRGYFVEGRRLVEASLLRDSPIIPEVIRASAYNSAGFLAFSFGDHVHAEAMHSRALAIYRDLQDERMIAFSLVCTTAQYLQLDLAKALADSAEAAAICDCTSDEEMEVFLATNYAIALKANDRLQAAAEVLERGLRLARKHELYLPAIYLLANLAQGRYESGDLDQSELYWIEALDLSRRLRHERMIAQTLIDLAKIKMDRGELETALRYTSEAIALSHQIDDTQTSVFALMSLSEIYVKQGDVDQGQLYAQSAVKRAEDSNDVELQNCVREWAASVEKTNREQS